MDPYEKFYQLHFQQGPFLLGNAWNARSAQVIETAGFQALGTSSGAIAGSMGYEDGEKIPFRELLNIVQRIKAVTSIPLSVDMERGYSDDLNILIDNVQKLIDNGVSGINIEDAQGEDIYLRKLECIREHLEKTNQHLFINARTDAFLQKLPDPLNTTIKRAQRYQQAGADGLFVTAVPDIATIKEITASTPLPVNIVSTSKLTVPDLTNAGVKRISMAVMPYRAAYGHLEKAMQQITSTQSFSALF
jgi:2-methylisocitrate lyase-like PEP mutase family enzyme